MTSIDEAIARERQQAEIHRNNIVPKEDYHNMPWIDKNNEASTISTEYHEQLAEWLEELKVLKENSISKEAFEKMKSKAHRHGYRQGYSKAIDDAKSVILQTLDNKILVDTLHLRLEQLKEQKK